jgi:SPP1 gp7 family putative phage head morphogenesis protein
MASNTLIQAARQRKATRGRKGLNRKAPVIPEPRYIERQYQAMLLAYVRELTGEVSDRLIGALPQMAQERDLSAPRGDSWADDLARIVDGLTVFGRSRSEQVINRLGEISGEVGNFNRRAFARAMSAVIGVDITQGMDGAWLRTSITSWSRENASLIRSIPERMLTDVEGIAQRALRAGADPRETSREIRERFGVTEARARLIGRDQVAKLNSDITKGRNQALGIETYEWSTSGDERVRESHKVMNGKLCRWDDATVYSEDGGVTWLQRSSIGGVDEHPGQDFQCRCVSRPILSDVLEAL